MIRPIISVAGVQIARSRRLRREARSALLWLDVKISDYAVKVVEEDIDLTRSVKAEAEIRGICKYLYVSGVLSKYEYKTLLEILKNPERALKEEEVTLVDEEY